MSGVDRLVSRVRGGAVVAFVGVVALVTAAAVAPSVAVAGVGPAVVTAGSVVRWGGSDRYAVSANISEVNFDPGVGTVYVANGLASADALAAGPVAGMGEGPILLVRKDSIPSAVAVELDRLNPAKVVILGGVGSVSATVEIQLANYTTAVVRWGGSDRYAVSAGISETSFTSGVGSVYVANGLASADALAAGPVAGMKEGPILLVRKDSIPAAVAAELDRLNPGRVVVLGGVGSVSAAVEAQLASYTTSVVRWGGVDRYAVSAGISEVNFAPGVGVVYLANGLASADALAAGPVAGMTKGPILLVKKDSIPPTVATELAKLNPRKIVVLGGTGSVSTTVENQLTSFVEQYPIRVSVASGGTQSDGDAYFPAISADGRYIAYVSSASNLVAGDTNEVLDVFVRDRNTGTTSRVSTATDGTEANGHSWVPAISGDGRYIAYVSDASNLVAGDTNGQIDVFHWDRDTGTTTRVSVASDGTQAAGGWNAAMSADGRYVTYGSYASNLVAGDTNGDSDVFLWDRDAGITTRVSVTSDGTDSNGWSDGPTISADGRFITYTSGASNLVPGDVNRTEVFLWDREAGATTRVPPTGGTDGNGWSHSPTISADGNYITFASGEWNPDGTYAWADVFVWDRNAGTTTRVSTATDGTQANGYSGIPKISGDGRFVVYTSSASNLVAGDTNEVMNAFVWDRETGTNARVSPVGWGFSVIGDYDIPAISADGRYITWDSSASSLVDGDTNGARDVFVTLNPLLP